MQQSANNTIPQEDGERQRQTTLSYVGRLWLLLVRVGLHVRREGNILFNWFSKHEKGHCFDLYVLYVQTRLIGVDEVQQGKVPSESKTLPHFGDP
jgi:hypothetical protein